MIELLPDLHFEPWSRRSCVTDGHIEVVAEGQIMNPRTGEHQTGVLLFTASDFKNVKIEGISAVECAR